VFGNLNDTAVCLDLAVSRAVYPDGLMNPVAMVVGEVAAEDAAQVPFVHHDHMIQTFPPDASDQSFNIRIGHRWRMHPIRRLSADVFG